MPKNNDCYSVNAKQESMLDFVHERKEMNLGRAMYYINRGSDEDDGCLSVRDVFATTLVLVKPGLSPTKIVTDLRRTMEYITMHRIDVKNFKY
ncbi:hypothetical protein MBRA_05095 [Methylobacterium brachiatum]|jgi:hypothetical protein|nr:hypothetical protein MBRA_05095 [Methylobacterium brachiatum]